MIYGFAFFVKPYINYYVYLIFIYIQQKFCVCCNLDSNRYFVYNQENQQIQNLRRFNLSHNDKMVQSMNEKNFKKYIPGMRNIKTAVAIFTDLLIFELLGFDNAFYACIASVICMQQTVSETVKAGKSRLAGTLIAAVIGLIIFYIGEYISNEYIYIFLIPVGTIIIIQACVMLKCSSSASIACVVFVSILTSHRIYGDNSIYPFARILETFIGVITATIVNKYLSKYYLDKIKEIIRSLKNK